MIRSLLSILFISCLMMLSSHVAATNPGDSKTVPLKKEKNENSDFPPDYYGRRVPSAPLMCTISESEILITGMDTSSVILYEAYDVYGEMLVSCVSQYEFITFIYAACDEIEIRFYTEDAILSGWLSPE